jgi:hypothetical protein
MEELSMRYTITMATETDPMVLANGRTVRFVRFQNADGTYPTNAHEVTSNTMAALYSTSQADKRGYLGSFPVGSLPAVHNEIDARQKATAWMRSTQARALAALIIEAKDQTPESTPADACDIDGYVDELCDEHHAQVAARQPKPFMGKRGDIYAPEPQAGWGRSRSWRRTIGDNDYTFNVVNMPDGELRLFVSKYNGYLAEYNKFQGMQYSCAWSPVHSIILKAPESPPVDPDAQVKLMSAAETKAAQLDYLKSIPGRYTDDTRALAAALYGAGAATKGGVGVIDEAFTGQDREAYTVWSEGMCRTMSTLCTNLGTVRLACCAILVCSGHALVTTLRPCADCGKAMSAQPPAYDEADIVASRAEEPIDETPESPDDWFVYQTHPERAVDLTPVVPSVEYGVSVEWWEDQNDAGHGGAKRGVIGRYAAWEQAAEEVRRLKRLERFEFVHGVIPLYATERDV